MNSASGFRIAILGAGFSGLTLARNLCKKGFQVEIFEAQSRAGGLIASRQKEVLVETAAHAILASAEVEKLFQELNLEILEGGHLSQSKWIFRERPRNVPLSIFEIGKTLFFFLITKLRKNLSPQSLETVEQWCRKRLSRELNDFLISPAFQGVYGTTSDRLSASLIVGGLMSPGLRILKGTKRGSLAPRNGMQQLIEALVEDLKTKNAIFHFDSRKSLSELQTEFNAVAIATSAYQAGFLLDQTAPVLSQKLLNLPRVSLVTATIGYQKTNSKIQGFGCLFPKHENFQSLGVIFNTDLFENRGPLESETWILPGEAVHQSDSEILSFISSDRQKIGFPSVEIQFSDISRWPGVLPLYGEKLESLLESSLFSKNEKSLGVPCLETFFQGARVQETSRPLYLSGNYLGGIGLTKILSYNERLAQRIESELAGGK